jgi:ParB family chromosome partitioning protein
MTDTQAEFQVLPIDQIVESSTNPRRRFSEQGLQELVDSVRKHGVLSPLLLRPVNDHFEIIAGARRFRAARVAELRELPARVKKMSDDEALELQILDNLIREDVHPMDEAMGYRSLLERPGYDVPAIAARVEKSESYIYQRLKLLDLTPEAQAAFLEDRITAGHAILIARLQPKEQAEALDACYDRHSRVSNQAVLVGVKQLAGWIDQNIHLDLHAAPFSKADPDLVPAAGACVTCQKRTGYMPQLFPDVARKDTCTDPRCHQSKILAHIAQKKVESEKKGQKLVEVSSSYKSWGGKPKASDPVYRDNYTEVKKKDRCESTQKAIVVSGYRGLGQVMDICADPKCKTHHGSGGYTRSQKEIDQAKEEKRKQKIELAIRTEIIGAVLREVTACAWSGAANEFVVRSHISEMQHSDVQAILKRHGWKSEEKYADVRSDLSAYVKNLLTDELNKLQMEMCLIGALNLGYSADARPKGLLEAAALYKIDVKAIEKAVAAETKKAEKKPKSAKPETKKPSGKRNRRKKRRRRRKPD